MEHGQENTPYFAKASSFAKAEFILSFVEGEDTSSDTQDE
jgi:hypothetical protein